MQILREEEEYGNPVALTHLMTHQRVITLALT